MAFGRAYFLGKLWSGFLELLANEVAEGF
jgi:hypothetical protein